MQYNNEMLIHGKLADDDPTGSKHAADAQQQTSAKSVCCVDGCAVILHTYRSLVCLRKVQRNLITKLMEQRRSTSSLLLLHNAQFTCLLALLPCSNLLVLLSVRSSYTLSLSHCLPLAPLPPLRHLLSSTIVKASCPCTWLSHEGVWGSGYTDPEDTIA
jgi:hypothetical protein